MCIYFGIWLISLISLVQCLYICPNGAHIDFAVNEQHIQNVRNLLLSNDNFITNQNRFLYKGDLMQNGNVRYQVSVQAEIYNTLTLQCSIIISNLWACLVTSSSDGPLEVSGVQMLQDNALVTSKWSLYGSFIERSSSARFG
ncbi:CSEP0474 putative effector protein [Blumeria hordei DH14]|uniref:CSEP0474 putative effector protein n=1 Tax=Blumeria graminis f. sp. hordei (strain DH14) TaxID=546991 RepID=N1JPN3_BLUG1|nr:CSEP0474 putative effector protein [Blumeria hordei DH14]